MFGSVEVILVLEIADNDRKGLEHSVCLGFRSVQLAAVLLHFKYFYTISIVVSILVPTSI